MGWGYGEDKVAKGIGDYVIGKQTGTNWHGSSEGAFGASAHKPSRKTGGGGEGGSNNGCFPAGTRIATPQGEVAIEKLQRGDCIFSYNEKKGVVEVNPILCIKEYSENPIWEIDFQDGSQVRTTPVHSFFSVNEWKMARRISSGESLSTFNYQSKSTVIKQVTTSRPTNQTETVYNLIVGNNYSFIANGLLVHSFTYLRLLRVVSWSLISIFLRKRYFATLGKPARI